VCAAVGFEDDEHLYHLEIADGFYSAQKYVWVERAEPAGNHTLSVCRHCRCSGGRRALFVAMAEAGSHPSADPVCRHPAGMGGD